MKTLTRRDLVRCVSLRTGDSQEQCKVYVGAVIDCLSTLMMQADPELRIELRNLGVYTVKRTARRPAARNPKTGETVVVPSRRKVHFKASKRIKKVLDQSLESLGYEPLVRSK